MGRRLQILEPDLKVPMAGVDYVLNLPKPHLSYSQIDLYMQCPTKYEKTYIQGVREPSSSAPMEGTVMSKVMDTAGRQFLEKGKWPSIKQMQKMHGDFARQLWTAAILETGKPKGDSMDVVIRRGQMFLQNIWDELTLNPIMFKGKPGCEYEIKQDIAGVPFLGFVDMVEEGVVSDFKVARSTEWYDADHSLQLGTYSHCLQREYVRFIVFCKESMCIETLTSRRDLKKNALWVNYSVAMVAKAISSGSFPPCNPAKNKLCSPKFCSFYSSCYGACR